MTSRITLIIALIVLVPGHALADNEKPWKGSGEIGYLMTSGNSETETLNAKAGLKYETSHILAGINLAGLYSSEKTEADGVTEDRTSAEKYNGAAKVGYKFTPADYVFLTADYEDDRFSGYDYRSNYTAGYGRKVVNTDSVKLDIEIGPGYRYNKTDDGQTEKDALFRGSAMFDYRFSEGVSFQQEVTVLAGSDNTDTTSVTALKAQIVSALSMKITYRIEHNSDVPAGKEKTDRETALTLVYDF